MDEKLIQGISEKDEQAVRQMVHEYQNYIYTIALRIVKTKELAEEITQDVFLKVIAKIDTFNRKAKFSTWLFTIVYRTALNAADHSKKELSLEKVSLSEQQELTSIFEENVQERQRILWQGIDSLKTEQGVVVSLFYLQQFSIAEIAGIMNIPKNTVKSLLFRGRSSLKTILLKEYEVEDLL